MFQLIQYLFRAFFSPKNDVVCPASWRHLSPTPHQFPIYEDVGVDNKYGGVGRYDVAILCFRVKWCSRVAPVIEDSILENCQPRHQKFSLTLLTEKPWDEFGRYWQVTYFQQIVSNCSLPRSRFLDVIQRSQLKERARNCSIWRMRIRFSLV